MTALEKSLILSYLHTKQAIANLEVAVHEMRVLGNERTKANSMTAMVVYTGKVDGKMRSVTKHERI